MEDLEEDDQYLMELVLNVDSLEKSLGERVRNNTDSWPSRRRGKLASCDGGNGGEDVAGNEQPREGT